MQVIIRYLLLQANNLGGAMIWYAIIHIFSNKILRCNCMGHDFFWIFFLPPSTGIQPVDLLDHKCFFLGKKKSNIKFIQTRAINTCMQALTFYTTRIYRLILSHLHLIHSHPLQSIYYARYYSLAILNNSNIYQLLNTYIYGCCLKTLRRF